jgi:protein O-mannosyl-transferase
MLGAAVTVATYLQAYHFPFVSDDLAYLTTNTRLAGLHLKDLWRLFTEPYNPYEFLPLRDLSYWFDIRLFGLNPAAFRLHNIILYLLCLPLVYATTLGLWRYFREADAAEASWVAAAVTVLFALHPVHVESVVWISGRKDVLSGLFSLLALWFAVNARQEQQVSARYAAAALIALLAAILSKATAVAVAPVIALLWILFWRDIPAQRRRHRQLLWPFATLLLAAGAALIFTANSAVKEPFYAGIEVVTRALAVLGWLARLAVSPESHHLYYPGIDGTQLNIMVALGAVVFAACAASAVILLRKRSLESFALIVFVLLCLPYLQLVPFYTFSLVSDRFLALAVWPAMLLIVSFAWRLKRIPRLILLFLIALALCYQTVERPRDWSGLETLIDADVRAYPGYYQPAFQKIWIQMRVGQYNDAYRTADSITIPEFRDIMTKMIQAAYAVNFVTPGKLDDTLALLQDFEVALKRLPAQSRWDTPMRFVRDQCRNMLALKGARLAEKFPDEALVRYKAGLWTLDDHNYQDAVSHLRAAIESRLLPDSLRGTAYRSLGVALLKSGQAAEAEAPLRAALEQSPPDLSAYCQLSEIYQRSKRMAEAASAATECRNHAPDADAAR